MHLQSGTMTGGMEEDHESEYMDLNKLSDPDSPLPRWKGWQSPKFLHDYFTVKPWSDITEEDLPEIRVIGLWTRRAISFAPIIVFLGLLGVIVEIDILRGPSAISNLVLDPTHIAAFLIFGILGGMFALVMAKTTLVQSKLSAFSIVFVYSLIGALALSTILVIFRFRPTNGMSSGFHTAGFFLSAMFGAGLAHDATQKLETLLNNLSDMEMIEGSLLDENGLGRDPKLWSGELPLVGRRIEIPFVVVIAGLVMAGFSTIWMLGNGPHSMDSKVMFLVNVFVDFVIVIFLLRFLIIIRRLHFILRRSSGSKTSVSYIPFHPDNAGGFGEIGRVAMQINHMIVLAGIYYVYRITIIGYPVFDGLSLWEKFLWTLNYFGPIVVYGAVVLFWLYYTFFAIHQEMKQRKRLKRAGIHGWIENNQTDEGQQMSEVIDRRTKIVADNVEVGYLLDRLNGAPVWPISATDMYSLLVLNIFPVFISLIELIAIYHIKG